MHLFNFFRLLHKFVQQVKRILKYLHNHLILFLLNHRIPFMLMDIFKFDNNIRYLVPWCLKIGYTTTIINQYVFFSFPQYSISPSFHHSRKSKLHPTGVNQSRVLPRKANPVFRADPVFPRVAGSPKGGIFDGSGSLLLWGQSIVKIGFNI